MTTCARCGSSLADYFDPHNETLTECPVVTFCQQRQLSNLHSLLRSVTISLEQAGGYCEAGLPAEAGKVIDSVLERLA